MKKLLLCLLPVLALVLTGCGSVKEDMEVAYAVLGENMANGYVIVDEFDSVAYTLDYVSDTEYTIDFTVDDVSGLLICGDPEIAILKRTGFEDTVNEKNAETCGKWFNSIREDLAFNVNPNEVFNVQYNVAFAETEDGFESVGTFSDDSTYTLKINTDGTKLEYKSDVWYMKVETK